MRTLLIFLLVIVWSSTVRAEISTGRIKGNDEPHIVSWRVLEGVTEPFGSNLQESVPAWKQMKNAADQKAAGMAIQQALHEYGQLLRHPYMFGDMPTEERYDVFLSMSKLLKTMGFHQRAELLLYEAMSYTTNPHEAHLQLGLLFLDKEDLEKAKLHLKNCLFFKENDVLILIHLSVILIAEGRIHEAKFFLSRILSGLEARVRTLSFMVPESDIKALTTARVDYKVLTAWVEDLIVKVFYGEFRFTPSSTMDMLKLFSNLYRYVSDGELSGRFVFDLGQSLYEGGRPKIGQMMMKRGFETSDAQLEGEVSTAIVDLRLAMDYPVVPDSVVEVLDAYLNMTEYLSATSASYSPIDLENVMDLYWPLPLLAWSALPVMPVLTELLWRFQGGPVRSDPLSAYWLADTSHDDIMDLYHPQREVIPASAYLPHSARRPPTSPAPLSSVPADMDREGLVTSFDALKGKDQQVRGGVRTVVIPPTSTGSASRPVATIKVEVGILGGHMNNHPVGQMVFRRLLGLNQPPADADSSGTDWRELINLTLLALPLVPDAMTRRIAGGVGRIVNLPIDTAQAWRVIEGLHLDIVVFPDWQPFPDQQSTLFQSRRLAPVQVCMFVRGSSCASVAVDYYLLPMELEEAYLRSTPAADLEAKVAVNTSVPTAPITSTATGDPDTAPTSTDSTVSSTATTAGSMSRQVVPQEGSFVPPAIPATTSITAASPPPSTASSRQTRTVLRPLRPPWREFFSEQVVLLDWPLLTPAVVQGVAGTVAADEATAVHRRTQRSSGDNQSQGGGPAPQQDLTFTPLEVEGRIFFDNQPVAVLPVHPTYASPLMDELLFKVMRSVPSLQLVLALPESFFTHARDAKHKISWARKLVRRLWARGGSLFHRIRLLPAPLSDQRLLQLLRQADLVLDSFPFGASFYFLALATSVGTPVITLRSGTALQSSKDELKEVRNFLALHRQRLRQRNVTAASPIVHHVASQDLPYFPAVSSVAGFYDSIGMASHFVANSSAEYFELATVLASNREHSYSLRVQLLEAVDGHRRARRTRPRPSATTTTSARSSASAGRATAPPSTMEDWEEEEPEGAAEEGWGEEPAAASEERVGAVAGSAPGRDCGHCVDDLGRFFLSVGVPFARARSWRLQAQQQRTGTADGTGAGRGNRRSKASGGEGPKVKEMGSGDSDDFFGTGAIS